MNEITFNDNCDICGKKDTPCRMHHLIPKRLIEVIPISRRKRWEFQKVKACNHCNNYLHPENKLYSQIEGLKKELRKYIPNEVEGTEETN